jgi:hypothetical protein
MTPAKCAGLTAVLHGLPQLQRVPTSPVSSFLLQPSCGQLTVSSFFRGSGNFFLDKRHKSPCDQGSSCRTKLIPVFAVREMAWKCTCIRNASMLKTCILNTSRLETSTSPFSCLYRDIHAYIHNVMMIHTSHFYMYTHTHTHGSPPPAIQTTLVCTHFAGSATLIPPRSWEADAQYALIPCPAERGLWTSWNLVMLSPFLILCYTGPELFNQLNILNNSCFFLKRIRRFKLFQSSLCPLS